MKRVCRLALLLSTLLVGGCVFVSKRPNQQWMTDIGSADTIILIAKGYPDVAIQDKATLKKLHEIYASSKWQPYRNTVPGHIGEVCIEFENNGDQTRNLGVLGTQLWELGSQTGLRTADLSEDDFQWLGALFVEHGSSLKWKDSE